MPDRPIMFSAPMVQALLDGRKTQTRRVLRPQPARCLSWGAPPPGTYPSQHGWSRFPYAPGDRLWVQEGWRTVSSLDRDTPAQMREHAHEAGWPRAWAPVLYEADGARDNWESGDDQGRRRWSRHMIRELSRLTLHVSEVRVERLGEITLGDCYAEGCTTGKAAADAGVLQQGWEGPFYEFRTLWNSLHGADAWDANPWVCAITFSVEHENIDHARAPHA